MNKTAPVNLEVKFLELFLQQNIVDYRARTGAGAGSKWNGSTTPGTGTCLNTVELDHLSVLGGVAGPGARAAHVQAGQAGGGKESIH